MTRPPSITQNRRELNDSLDRLLRTNARMLRVSLSREAAAYLIAARIVKKDFLRLNPGDSTLAHLVGVWVQGAYDFSTTAVSLHSAGWDRDWDERLVQLGKSLLHTEALLSKHLATVAPDGIRCRVCAYRFERERQVALSMMFNPHSAKRYVTQSA